MQTPAIEAANLTRRFGRVIALDGVSLIVHRGEFFSLLGPSGCGKTTLLRILAGLDTPDEGSLLVAGRDMLAVPAYRRPINTVFQSYALFPHLTVAENVAFGLKMKKVPQGEIKARSARAMDMAQVTELAQRKPEQLSGGQKQRVALARAVVNEPEVLLLDEPLGALDVKLRRQLQEDLRALQRRLGITFLHVTHDQDEALGLSDRLVVMNHGRIVQIGAPAELYESPSSAFVAQFVGGCNLLSAVGVGNRTARTALGELLLDRESPTGSFTVGARPERVELGAGINQFSGVVSDVTYTGPETRIQVDCDGTLIAVVLPNNRGAARLAVGERAVFHLPPSALLVLQS
jgi:spermidine/putrescine transport system ATP-binding protein